MTRDAAGGWRGASPCRRPVCAQSTRDSARTITCSEAKRDLINSPPPQNGSPCRSKRRRDRQGEPFCGGGELMRSRFASLQVIVLALSLVDCAQTGRRQGEAPSQPPAASRVMRLFYADPSHGYPLADTSGATTLIVKFRDNLLHRKLADGEALWGFGERFDALNMRGRTMESWVVDAWGGGSRSYICTPFLISSKGYGLFVNCTGKVRFDCGATSANELRIEVPESGLDVFEFKGTPREILAAYTKLVGRPRPVPDWVFEPWISRNSYLSEYEIDRVVDKMEAHGLKAGAVVLEAWAEGLQNFRFEQGRYPNPKEWIEKLHGRGYHVVCWESLIVWGCGR